MIRRDKQARTRIEVCLGDFRVEPPVLTLTASTVAPVTAPHAVTHGGVVTEVKGFESSDTLLLLSEAVVDLEAGTCNI